MVAILLLLAAASAAAETLELPDPQDLDGLVAYAMDQHPALAAADAGWEAAVARVDQVGSLPDPVFRWGEMIEPVETRVGPQQRVLSLQQPLPWPGTLGARGDAAAARVDMAAAGQRQVAVTVAANVRRSWAQAAWLAETLDVTARQLEIVRSLEGAVRSGYEAGQNGYGDLLQAQLEIARLEDRLRSLTDETLAAAANLNAALGRDPRAALELPANLTPEVGATAADTTAVHPQLEILDHDATAVRLEAEAARRGGWPALSLGVDWIQVGDAVDPTMPDSGKDAWVAKFGVTVPLWRGKHDGATAAAEARARSLDATRVARDQALTALRTRAAVALRDAERRRDLHDRELLPRARQAYEAVLAGYQTGGASFADVLAAERTLLELEHGLLAARHDLVVATADLDEATGHVPAAYRN